jgi:hypothetical protein
MRHEAKSGGSIGAVDAGTTVKTTKAISEDLSLLTVHREISNQYRLAIMSEVFVELWGISPCYEARMSVSRGWLNRTRTLNTFLLALIICTGTASGQTSDPLPHWNGGAAKKAITDFIAGVTTEHGPGYVPIPQRVRCSTMTVRSGRNSRCTCKWSSRWIVLKRSHLNIRSGNKSSHSKPLWKAI